MVAFIILHYKNLTDTLECISSIQALNSTNKKIVVVDNHTLSSEDVDILQPKIDHLIVLEDNLGFAKANNIGALYAIKHYNPSFLVVINNDTVIQQHDFISRIFDIHKEVPFDILGPKILCREGSGSVNPYAPLKTIDEVQKELDYQKKLFHIYQSSFSYAFLMMGIWLKRLFKKPKRFFNGEEREEGVALHGCALIFSKSYYQKFSDVFYDGTFLYHEESFLYQRAILHHLVTLYDPFISIFHKEGGSLDMKFGKKEREKKLFRTKEIIKSLELLKKEMR